MDLTFYGSGDNPLSDTMYPRKVTVCLWNSYLLSFTSKSFSRSLVSTLRIYYIYLSYVLENIRISSRYTRAKSLRYSLKVSLISA